MAMEMVFKLDDESISDMNHVARSFDWQDVTDRTDDSMYVHAISFSEEGGASISHPITSGSQRPHMLSRLKAHATCIYE